jgi:hypothetical protein
LNYLLYMNLQLIVSHFDNDEIGFQLMLETEGNWLIDKDWILDDIHKYFFAMKLRKVFELDLKLTNVSMLWRTRCDGTSILIINFRIVNQSAVFSSQIFIPEKKETAGYNQKLINTKKLSLSTVCLLFLCNMRFY